MKSGVNDNAWPFSKMNAPMSLCSTYPDIEGAICAYGTDNVDVLDNGCDTRGTISDNCIITSVRMRTSQHYVL